MGVTGLDVLHLGQEVELTRKIGFYRIPALQRGFDFIVGTYHFAVELSLSVSESVYCICGVLFSRFNASFWSLEFKLQFVRLLINFLC